MSRQRLPLVGAAIVMLALVVGALWMVMQDPVDDVGDPGPESVADVGTEPGETSSPASISRRYQWTRVLQILPVRTVAMGSAWRPADYQYLQMTQTYWTCCCCPVQNIIYQYMNSPEESGSNL